MANTIQIPEKYILENRDIIMVGQQPWDVEIGSNCKNIALEFSKYNRVLYVNAPLDRITVWKHSKDAKIKKRLDLLNSKNNGIFEVGKNIWNLYPNCVIESINWLPDNSFYTFINKKNNKRFAKAILCAVEELQFKNYILFNDNDIIRSFYLKEFLNPSISAYYSRDYMLGVDYWKKHGGKLEPLLIAKSDVCVANSVYLRDYCLQYNPKSFYVGQGCDLDDFKSLSLKAPHDLENIKHPIIGYVGALQGIRLDITVIEYIALQNPSWTIVLVGPEDDLFKTSRLHFLKNIHFLGSKPSSDLANYINSFDVCINPQLINEITIGNYPRKVDEYLNMGKPVVATNTNAMGIFSDYVYLCETKEDFAINIEKAIQENTKELSEKRKAFASTHSWTNSVCDMYRAIEVVISVYLSNQAPCPPR
jgi:glycosyltransferase involved in cell wall biosynthesis